MNYLPTFLTLIFGLLSSGLFSQIDTEKLEGLSMRNIGPAGMSGRVTAIDVNLSKPQQIYAGTASGGVWKSEDGGMAWKPIFDDAPTQSIGSVKINQQNPDEIWVGTGEGNPRNSHNSGEGVFKSIDGGENVEVYGTRENEGDSSHRYRPF